MTYAYTNFGIILDAQKRNDEALIYYEKALPSLIEIASKSPEVVEYQLDLAEAYAWLADAFLYEDLEKSINFRTDQIQVYDGLRNAMANDKQLAHRNITGHAGLARAQYLIKNYEETKRIVDEILPKSIELVNFEKNNSEWLSTLTILHLIRFETSLAQKDDNEARHDLSELDRYESKLRQLTNNEAGYFGVYKSRSFRAREKYIVEFKERKRNDR